MSTPDTTKSNGTKVKDAPFYCPGCGRRYNYQRECVGMSKEAPHQPIEVVSTDELADGADPAKHTPAPNTTVAR